MFKDVYIKNVPVWTMKSGEKRSPFLSMDLDYFKLLDQLQISLSANGTNAGALEDFKGPKHFCY
jgi:hypothetical protein